MAQDAAEAPAPVVTVALPAGLTAPGPAVVLTCHGRTVGEAIEAVAQRRPHLSQRMLFRQRLLVHVALNGRPLPPAEALGTTLSAGDRLDITPPVAGG